MKPLVKGKKAKNVKLVHSFDAINNHFYNMYN